MKNPSLIEFYCSNSPLAELFPILIAIPPPLAIVIAAVRRNLVAIFLVLIPDNQSTAYTHTNITVHMAQEKDKKSVGEGRSQRKHENGSS